MGGAVANTMNSNAGTPVTGRAYTPSYTGGSGGKGGGRPTQTAMGTPITYGKSYINNLSRDYVAPLAKETVVTDGGGGGDGVSVGGGTSGTTSGVTDGNTANSITGLAAPANNSIAVSDAISDAANVAAAVSADAGDDGDGDGTAGAATSGSPGWANGTTSVPGYYNGTMGVDDDPWAWTRSQPVAAPLAAEIKPSTEQALGRMPDRTEQQLSSMLMGKGVDAATKGIDTAYKAYNAAPLAAAAETGATAATTGAAAATTTGATGAAALGGEAALAAMGPVGAVIGGALLAKKLKIF